MHKLAQSVLGYIRKHDLLRPGDRVGVAVSGGADSVALLRLMIELRGELGVVLLIVHLNHNLRGAESDADEQFVSNMSVSHGLEFRSESHDVKTYATEKKLSLETAAREVRYEFFKDCLRNKFLDKIATAHTLDDQAETVLMKLARGAGTRGLAGIYPKVSIQHSAFSTQRKQRSIIRPLLETKRRDLESYLAEIRQDWREDGSNRDLRHTRNRIRHGILPRFERHVNPAVREALAETAEISRADEEYWAAEIERILPKVWVRPRTSGGSLLKLGFADQPSAIQRRLIRAAAESLGLTLEFGHVEEVRRLSNDGENASLPEGWTVSRNKGELRFEPAGGVPTDEDYEYQLSIPGKVTVTEARVQVETLLVLSGHSSELYNPEQLVEPKFVQQALTIRNWHAGERFWPAHMKEPKKLKELLQDRHITGREKKLWPVVASGGEIVWVRGFGIRRDFQSKDTSGVLIRDFSIFEGNSRES
ncbi:MAG: tRNA(Ile)-lysidine synthase [Pseudonocardiales bacterium]|nr:tRNA(Ile)-lysidine synthase [Pseudonocardiales bacterium]